MTLLKMRTGTVSQQLTEYLKNLKKLYARSNGSFEESVVSAAYYAKKHNTPMYIYSGNSYMVALWRVSCKPRDYLCPIGNTGSRILCVDPDLTVTVYDVLRG